jgi:hypothetical protein
MMAAGRPVCPAHTSRPENGPVGALLAAERDRLATLIRVCLAGQTESEESVAAALAPLPLADALAAGLVEPHGDGLHAAVDLDVYGDWWVVSDLDAGRPKCRSGEHLRSARCGRWCRR